MVVLSVPHPHAAVTALWLTLATLSSVVRTEVTNTRPGEYETFISDIREQFNEVRFYGWC